jgi:saccharopine dehydrogenase (NAD+, L-lysine-forming)
LTHTVLLYGATGYTGQLIAAEAAFVDWPYRTVLAGRDGAALAKIAKQHDMEYRVFDLEDPSRVKRALRDITLVINAAGPFALTGDRLAKSALDSDCHYVDINGEVDVYQKLDDLDRFARDRNLAIVCSAGHTAAGSDLMLEAALRHLTAGPHLDYGRALGTIRIAMAHIVHLSRGSLETLWRSLREQVTVVRGSSLWHEPVGKIEHTFDFRDHSDSGAKPDLRIGSAANLVDTLSARRTVARHGFSVTRLESYVEAGTAVRLGYQLASYFAPVAAIPGVRFLVEQQLEFLPEGPTPEDLRDERHVILLDIEDPVHARLIDWRWDTPNVYQFTAQIVVEIAAKTIEGSHVGWLTPGAVFHPQRQDLTNTGSKGALRDCRLNERRIS